MDAFEHVVAELFWAQGYWVRTSVKVDLAKADKVALGNPSMPRPELDIVAYRGSDNSLLAIECKSFLDSRGVTYGELCGKKKSKTYKLFRRPELREMVLDRLVEQLVQTGFCRAQPTLHLGLAAGRVKKGDQPSIESLFEEMGWLFWGPQWLRDELTKLSTVGYDNQVSTVVAKLLLKKI